MSNKTIGVVIATYNGEKYIQKQLESILEQSLPPDFIVISDGGSKDNTVMICEEYLSNTSIKHCILTSEEQLSVPVNFNRALEKCDCDYVFFSDQDDFWKRKKIEITVNSMNEANACMAFTNAQITDSELIPDGSLLWDTVGFRPTTNITQYKQYDKAFIKELVKRNVVTGMTVCITSNLRTFIMPITRHAIHDKWIALLAIHFGDVIAINRNLVLYRQHGNNAIGTKKNIQRSIKNRNTYKNRLKEKLEMYRELKKKIDNMKIETGFDFVSYLKYLRLRLAILERKQSRTAVFSLLKSYHDYESKPIAIMVKDMLISFT